LHAKGCTPNHTTPQRSQQLPRASSRKPSGPRREVDGTARRRTDRRRNPAISSRSAFLSRHRRLLAESAAALFAHHEPSHLADAKKLPVVQLETCAAQEDQQLRITEAHALLSARAEIHAATSCGCDDPSRTVVR